MFQVKGNWTVCKDAPGHRRGSVEAESGGKIVMSIVPLGWRQD